jgi:hypothetical protein
MARRRNGFWLGLIRLAPSRRRLSGGSAIAALAAMLAAPPFADAAPPGWLPPAPPAEKSVAVKDVSGRTVPKAESDQVSRASAGSPVWPAGGTASVAVDVGASGAARSAVPAKASSAGAGRAGGLAVRVRKQGLDPSDARADPKAEARLRTMQGPAAVRLPDGCRQGSGAGRVVHVGA